MVGEADVNRRVPSAVAIATAKTSSSGMLAAAAKTSSSGTPVVAGACVSSVGASVDIGSTVCITDSESKWRVVSSIPRDMLYACLVGHPGLCPNRHPFK